MGTKILFLIVAGSVFSNGLLAAEEPVAKVSGAAQAQAKNDQEKGKKELPLGGSETVTVVAEAYQVEEAKTPNRVIIVTAERIAQSGTNNLERLLEQVMPGRVAGYGGKGSASSIFFNGARSSDTVVVLDGIRISNNSSLSMSNWSLTGIDRMELMAGSASTLYGGDAHGGVISLSSTGVGSTDGFSGYAFGQGSTLGQTRGGATAIYNTDGTWVQGSGDFESHPQATKTDKDYRHASGHIGVGKQFGDSMVTLNHRSLYKAAPIPWAYTNAGTSVGRDYNPGRQSFLRNDITTASFKSAFFDNLYAEFNLGNIAQNTETFDPRPTAWNNGVAHMERFQGNAMLNWKQDNGGLALLFDSNNEKFWQADDDANKADHTAIALEGNYEPLSVLRFVASVRQQWDTISQPGLPADDIEQMTWKVGANLLLPSGFRVYASTGTAWNVPSLYALASNQAYDMAPPSNEESTSIMLGVGFKRDNWWVRADASRINYKSLTVFTYGPTQVNGYWGWYENLDDVRIQGVEFTGGTSGDDWSAELFVRSQEGRRLNSPEAQQLSWFQERPFFSAGLRASYKVNTAFDMGLHATYIGPRYMYPYTDRNVDPPKVNNANKTTYIDATIFAQYRVNNALSVILRGENLFQPGITMDEWIEGKDIGKDNYSVREGYPSFGRSLNLEVRYKF